MDASNPPLALLSRVAASTLGVLGATTTPLTGRAVARQAHASQPAVQAALDHLALHGVVTSQQAGRANLYTLNRDHVANPVIELLLGMKRELVTRIRREIETWDVQPLHASLFGSFARGDGDTASDIDLFLVAHFASTATRRQGIWDDQIFDLERCILVWTGNRAAPVTMSIGELQTMHRRRQSILAAVVRDGLVITGSSIEALLHDRVLRLPSR